MAGKAFSVQISHADFDVRALQESLLSPSLETGAVATFTGHVRGDTGGEALEALEIEYYPGMTESCIEEFVSSAARRWKLTAMRVWHRVGRLSPGDRIVWVGAAAGHRSEAFAGCEYVMDYLKIDAPFWKKEIGTHGARWVEASGTDRLRRDRWHEEE